MAVAGRRMSQTDAWSLVVGALSIDPASAVLYWDSGDVIIMVRTVLYLTGTYWDSGDVIIIVRTGL